MADVSAVSGLDFLDDARAVATCDWDHDGDLDLWFTNRGAPRLRFLRNDCGNMNHFLAVRLQGTSCNRDAIGARAELVVRLDEGVRSVEFGVRNEAKYSTLVKTLHAGDGFLAQSSKWIHFGLGERETVDQLVVRWPDGRREAFADLQADRRYKLVQGSGRAQPLPDAPRTVELDTTPPVFPEPSERARVVLRSRVPLPHMSYDDFEGVRHVVGEHAGQPTLVNLWASWCQPCVDELGDLTDQSEQLRQQNVEIVALCVDPLSEARTSDLSAAKSLLARLDFPFLAAVAHSGAIDQLEVVQRTLIDVQQPLPLPSSFLIDPQGRVAVIYKGPVDVDQLLSDIRELDELDEEPRHTQPFDGRRLVLPHRKDPIHVALTFFAGGYVQQAISYLRQCTDIASRRLPGHEQMDSAELHYFLGTLLQQQGDAERSLEAYRNTLQINSDHRQALRNLAYAYVERGEHGRAVDHFNRLLQQTSNDLKLRHDLARALEQSGDAAQAVAQYRAILKLEPRMVSAANNLAWILATHPDVEIRDGSEAVRLAEFLSQASNFQNPMALDTLAAAYAEQGRFEDAVQTAEKSLEFATAGDQQEQAAATRTRLELYRSKTPYHEKHGKTEN